jgi:hypothetical protein
MRKLSGYGLWHLRAEVSAERSDLRGRPGLSGDGGDDDKQAAIQPRIRLRRDKSTRPTQDTKGPK